LSRSKKSGTMTNNFGMWDQRPKKHYPNTCSGSLCLPAGGNKGGIPQSL
jgi:hypothetical protein